MRQRLYGGVRGRLSNGFLYSIPDDKSIQKIIYLALRNASKKWTMPIKNWSLALNQFEILCGEFRHDLVEKIN